MFKQFFCVCVCIFFLSYHVSMKWSFLTHDRISFGGFVCLSDPFWSQACCASHHIFAANETMPQIHGTSCFVALFFFISYFVFPCLIILFVLCIFFFMYLSAFLCNVLQRCIILITAILNITVCML